MTLKSPVKFIVIIMSLSILAITAGCGGQNTTTSSTGSSQPATSFTTYSNPKGFSLEYPSTWTKQEELANSDVQILAPAVKNFSPGITIKKGQLDPKAPEWSSPDALKKHLIEGYTKQIRDFNLVRTDITSIAGYNTLKIEFTSTDPDPSSTLKAHSIQYWTIIDNTYLLSEVMRPLDNTTLYDKEFDHILESIKITK